MPVNTTNPSASKFETRTEPRDEQIWTRRTAWNYEREESVRDLAYGWDDEDEDEDEEEDDRNWRRP